MHLFEPAELCAALSDEQPCGEDLSEDFAFSALEELARGKPEQQYGDTIIAAVEPDWRQVQAKALELAGRSRDLRIALLLLRAGTRMDGLPGAALGIRLVQGLLEQHWAHVHPQLDAEDDDDPTERLNALAPLAHAQEWPADLRATVLVRAPFELKLRDIELAFNRNDPAYHDKVPSEAGALQALADAEARLPGTLAALQTLDASARAIDQLLSDRVGAGTGPDLAPLRRLLHLLNQAVRRLQESAGAEATGGAGAHPGAADAAATEFGAAGPAAAVVAPQMVAARPAGFDVGAIASREDAVRALGRIIEWIERNDPSNPAPLLIRRAQRLINKSFLDILKDLAPDAVEHIQQLAGLDREEYN
ncbi:MAG: hypothetical protein RJA44_2325 [Pseudomonadota bacterium]